jgi:acetyl esterase/lipase
MRVLINLGGLVPLPADAMVTPVTFRVRRRRLRGILAEFDAAESGTRELQGEWVVGKRLWRRLQNEWRATQGVRPAPGAGFVAAPPPPAAASSGKGRVILFLHGGAYYCFSAATHRLITIPLSKYADARVFAVNYRLAPETRFPGPLHDAVSAYLRLVDDLHVPPSNILVGSLYFIQMALLKDPLTIALWR